MRSNGSRNGNGNGNGPGYITQASLSFLLPIVVALVTSVAFVSSIGGRTTELSNQLKELKVRYEREVVPRGEHELRYKETETRLDKIDRSMDRISVQIDGLAKDVSRIK